MKEYLIDLCTKARGAQAKLAVSDLSVRNDALEKIACALVDNAEYIVTENKKDLAAARESGLTDAMCDRLMLNLERIEKIAASVRKLIALDDPLKISQTNIRPNGLEITYVRVPLGNIAVIYEARPNVTADVAAICIKSGNAAILRGGKEAYNSNLALEKIIKGALVDAGLDGELVSLVHDTTRESSNTLMKLNGYVDLLIPRGGSGLINSVVENATVPVIETGAGNCHTYVDADADLEMAEKIVINAKVSRPSVCNACEKLLVHKDIAEKFLPEMVRKLRENNVEVRADVRAEKIVPDILPCSDDDLTREYNDYIISVFVTDGIDEAIAHINKYSTKHSECIVTENAAHAERFLSAIDSAAVYVNASTRFTDGEEFGLGAEIGISTQKLHVRGPFALEALTTTKYKVRGNGQIR